MKTLWMQIDRFEGAIRKFLKTNATGIRVRGHGERDLAWDTPTPVFCKKRLQAIENKREEFQKEMQEISRDGKLLKARHLRPQEK
jgi:hypothetical protein